MKGKFYAAGRFETEPGFPVLPVVACVVAFALVSALAVILLWLAVAALVLLGAFVAVAVPMRRRYPDRSPVVARQAEDLRADIAAHAPRAAVTVVNNYYLPPGAKVEGIGSVLPLRDAVIRED